MPHTVNGIGTWYWGKDRVHTVAGRCEFCGQHAPLRSYDTTLYVVVLFVPVIPLGRKRILHECPRCTRHRALSLKKWQQLQERDIAAANDAARNAPHDEEKAAAAIGTAVAYEAEEEFELLAEKFDRALPRAPLLQAAIASGFQYFGKTDRAEAHLNKSLAAKDDPEVREALAMLMLRTGRPDAARAQLAHVTRDGKADKLPLLMALVETYQARGQHVDALALLDEIESAFAGVAKDAGYRKTRETSEKHRATGKPINKKLLKTLAPQGVRRGSFAGMLPRLIPPAIAAVLLAWYLGAAVQKGRSRPVHLVNGLNLTYDVDINGRNYSLPAYAHRQINVPEGELKIDVRRLNLSRTASLRTSFWSRPFRSPTFVINPDGVALVAWEQVIYVSGNTSPGDGAKPKVHAGKVVHDLGSVDYPFTDAPDQIKMGNDSSRVYKSRTHLLRDYGPGDAAELVLRYAGPEAAADLVRNWAELDPQNREVLALVPLVMKPDDAEALLRARLGVRPVEVDCHRVYQTLMERHKPAHDLRAEYAAMLAQDPDNATLCYLLARATHDRTEARRLLRRAAEAPKPEPYASYALAYDASARADFAAALEHARRARSLAPGDALFAAIEAEALLGLGRHAEALDRARQSEPAGDATNTEVYLLARTGDPEGARALAERHAARVEQATNKETADVVRKHFEAMLKYVAGDEAGAAATWATMPGDDARLSAALSTGRLSDAADVAAQSTGEKSTSYLLIYVAARLARDEAAAAKALDLAVTELRKGDRDSKTFADWLASDRAPDAGAAVELVARPAEKRVMLTALGLRHPSINGPCFALARQLNYDTRFPHLLLRRATDAPR